jgi:O-methyltransferase
VVTRVPAQGRLDQTHPDIETAFAEVHSRCAEFTMTSVERMYAMWKGVRYVCRENVAGDIVECGVWRGGSSMVAALTLIQEGEHARRLWLYDTFEGMTDPTAEDVSVHGLRAAEQWDRIRSRRHDWTLAIASLADVRKNMASTGIAADRLEYVRGAVEETIPSTVPERIAVLRLDTDWYESTRHELEHLWEHLEPGGVLLLDDYGHWAGARKAVDEFFAGRADTPLLVRVDYTGRVGVKR